jgi:DNA-binding NarL/FixJ family response regulator
LIVDDDGSFRAFVAALLVEAGLSDTVEAATGSEALAAVREQRPALVLLDVLLPDISGFQICRTLREEFGEDLPVIFVSGERIEPADRAVGLLVGADDYLVKPVDPDELLARLRRAITRSQHGPPVATAPRAFELTVREHQILDRLAQGQAQSEIAAELVISPKTVASHVQRILAKLGVHSRAQAVAAAYQLGIIGAPARERVDVS